MLKYQGTIDGFYVSQNDNKYTLSSYDNLHITSNNSSDKINEATIPDGYKAQVLVPIMNQNDGTVQYKLVTVSSNELQKATTIGDQTNLYANYSSTDATLNDRIAQSGIYVALHKNSDGTYTWQFSHDGKDYNGFNYLGHDYSDLPGFIKKVYSPMYAEAIAKALQESGMSYSDLSGNDAAFPLTMLYTLVPEEQSVQVNYIDDTTHQVLKTDTLSGYTGSSVDINVKVPTHYVLKAGQNIPNSYTFTAHNDPINILVVPNMTTDYDTKSVVRTINITDPDGITKTIHQTAVLTRTGNKNEVTNEITWSSWSESHWDAFDTPVMPGYTPNIANVPYQVVDNNSEPVTINISYIANEQSIRVIYKYGDQIIKTDTLTGKTGQTVPVNVQAPDGYHIIGSPVSEYTFKATDNADIIIELAKNAEPQQPAKPGSNNSEKPTINNGNQQSVTPASMTKQKSNTALTAHNSQAAQKLPQTGNEESRISALAILLSGLGLGMAGGLLSKKKRDQD